MAETQFPTPSIVQTPAPPEPSQVYSASNIQQAATNPAPKPDLSDPMGLYDYYLNSPEIQQARTSVSDLQGQINSSQQALRTTTRALENQNERAMGGTGASVNLIGRQVGRARQLTADELAGLGENYQAAASYLDTLLGDAQNRYSIANEQRSQIQDLIRQTGGKAGISYTDSYEQAVSKAEDYLEEQRKDAYKDELKAMARELGISTKTKKGGTKSIKSLEKDIAKYNKRALEQAQRMNDLDYQIKLKSLNKSSGSGRSGGNSAYNQALALKQSGVSWGDAAARLGKEYDLMPGSEASKALDAAFGGIDYYNQVYGKQSDVSGETQKIMNELGVSQDVAEALIKEELGL